MALGISSDMWVAALVRRAQGAGAFATIAHKGDAQRGDVLVKVTRERGKAQLYAPVFSLDGAGGFERLPAGIDDPDEADVDALIARRIKADRDVWVIEIEDRAGRHFLVEAVR